MKPGIKYISIFLLLLHFHCSEQKNKVDLQKVFAGEGKASWYGPGFHGKKTACGQKFDIGKLTAAHKTLEFGTLVRVTNIENNQEVVVEINDRGPFSKHKIIDLSKAAAARIDLVKAGIAEVRLEIVGYKKMNSEAIIKHYRNLVAIKKSKKKK